MSTACGYDALVLVSFGGPEGPADVLPFLENVTAGRGIPRKRLLAVAEHYHRFGGVSPINEQNRALLDAIRADVAAAGLDLPVYWGNRNWRPYLTDTLRAMSSDGVRRAAAFVTSAYSSYSGCRQYQDDIALARAAVGPDAPTVEKLRHYFNHPGFVAPMVENARAALARLPAAGRGGARLVFSAHSIPLSAARSSGPTGDGYPTQLREAAGLVAEGVGGHRWDLVYQSRSGPATQPWLEPNVVDHLDVLVAEGVSDVVVVPIGFVSDHLEVCYDLDTEARERADELGLRMERAATVGTDPRFVAMIRDLVVERATARAARPALGRLGASSDVCPRDCCPAPVRPGAARAS